MNNILNHLHRDLGRRIEFENPEGLLGPIVVVCHQISDEAARFAESLGFGKTKVGFLDFRLSPFSIIDVGIGSIPLHDLAGFITHGIGTKEKPSVLPVEAAQSCFGFTWLARSHDGLPYTGKSV